MWVAFVVRLNRFYNVSGTDVSSIVEQFILDRCEEYQKAAILPFAEKVQKIVDYVSWSTEMQDKDKVLDVIYEIPELAVVQVSTFTHALIRP